MPKMTAEQYRERVSELDMPPEVRAAVEVLIAYAAAKGVQQHMTSNMLLIAKDEDTATELILDLAIC